MGVSSPIKYTSIRDSEVSQISTVTCSFVTIVNKKVPVLYVEDSNCRKTTPSVDFLMTRRRDPVEK